MAKSKAETKWQESAGMLGDFNHIREWLIPLLEKRKTSIEQFARDCGLSRGIIYFYIHDRHRPGPQQMKKMCDVLGRPFAEGLAQYTPKPNGRHKS